MSNKLFLGNVSWSLTTNELKDVIEGMGLSPTSVSVINNPEGPRGFAFVEFATHEEAEQAKYALNELVVGGRPLRADYARQTARPERGSGGGGGRPKSNRGGGDRSARSRNGRGRRRSDRHGEDWG